MDPASSSGKRKRKDSQSAPPLSDSGVKTAFGNHVGAAGAHAHYVHILLRNPHVAGFVPVAGGVLGRDGNGDGGLSSGLEKNLAEAFEFLGGTSDGGGCLRDIQLHCFGAEAGTGVFDIEGEFQGLFAVFRSEVGDLEGGVRKTVAKGESDGSVDSLVKSVANIDILPVQDTAALGTEIEVCGIVLIANRERKRKFARRVHIAKEDIGDSVPTFIPSIPGLYEGWHLIDPRHFYRGTRLDDYDRVCIRLCNSGNELIQTAWKAHMNPVSAFSFPLRLFAKSANFMSSKQKELMVTFKPAQTITWSAFAAISTAA